MDPVPVEPDDCGADMTSNRNYLKQYFGRLRSTLTARQSDIIMFLASLGGLAFLTLLLRMIPGIDVDKDGLGTVAQAVPATIIAVFIFVLGLAFIIAQLVIPARGSRAVSTLTQNRQLRLVVIAGAVLLGAALLLGTVQPDGEDDWRLDLATALVFATIGFVTYTAVVLATVLNQTINPDVFSSTLICGAEDLKNRSPKPQELSDDLFERLRILRGWLRTVNRIGESRDLQYAIDGTHKIVTLYRECLDRPGLDCVAACYPTMAPEPNGTEAAVDKPWKNRWFADELGRALVRAIESGVRGNTLRRDLFRLLKLFDKCIKIFAPGDGRKVYTDEASILIVKLVETGLGVRQSNPEERSWYHSPAAVLVDLYSYCSRYCADGSRPEKPYRDEYATLAKLALAGWLVVVDAIFPDGSSDPNFAAFMLACKDRGLSKNTEHINAAMLVARKEYLKPEWDVLHSGRALQIANVACAVPS